MNVGLYVINMKNLFNWTDRPEQREHNEDLNEIFRDIAGKIRSSYEYTASISVGGGN